MGGEQAATVLATITKDQRAREGKEVMTHINQLIRCSTGKRLELPFAEFAAKIINIMKDPFLEQRFDMALKQR